MFTSGAQLTIEAGSIIEFQNNSILEVEGQFTVNGTIGNEIYFVPIDTTNTSRIKLIESNNSLINNAGFFHLKNGMYINSSNLIKIQNCRFRNAQYSIELFNCNNAQFENNVISKMTDGLVSQETNLTLNKNIIIDNTENGIKSLSAKNTLIQNNIFKNCNKNGLGINVGGYAYTATNLEIYYNDYLSNFNQIYVGRQTICTANYNNFLDEGSYIIKTSSSTSSDTLNFKENYWGTISELEIQEKILDRMDRLGQNHEGPTIDFSDFLVKK
ncbi:MAG: hypothetical protein K8R79_10095, partial [Calditrichales bacterium]|nr:hypothetical protein [Calditrichales bacterium]